LPITVLNDTTGASSPDRRRHGVIGDAEAGGVAISRASASPSRIGRSRTPRSSQRGSSSISSW